MDPKDKKLKSYLRLPAKDRATYLDLITGLKMMEDIVKDMRNKLEKEGLPSWADIKKHNKIYGSENSKYLN